MYKDLQAMRVPLQRFSQALQGIALTVQGMQKVLQGNEVSHYYWRIKCRLYFILTFNSYFWALSKKASKRLSPRTLRYPSYPHPLN